jgi:hypothetical protein
MLSKPTAALRPTIAIACAVAASVAYACTGAIGDGGSSSNGGSPSSPSSSNPAANNQDASTSADGGSTVSPTSVSCTGNIVPGTQPIRRLTRTEYVNTVQDLFPKINFETYEFLATVGDVAIDGYDNNAISQSPTPLYIQQYRDTAEFIGGEIQNGLPSIIPCGVPTTSAEETTCGHAFINSFLPNAYRRPATSDELAQYTQFFDASDTSYGFSQAIAMIVEAALQSPTFLYRVELGGTPTVGQKAAPLTGYEIASRLSYYLWQTMPDVTLMQAAAAGDLATAGGVNTQAQRMLMDPRAKVAIENFHEQWLQLGQVDNISKDPTAFAINNVSSSGFGTLMQSTLHDSMSQFVEHVFWDEDAKISTLLTEPSAYVNDDLAALYGVTPPGSTTTLSLVSLDPTQRAGLLTQAGILAALGHYDVESPVFRGVYVMTQILCQPPPDAPAGVNTATPQAPSNMPQTTRELFESQHEGDGGPCSGCHHLIDGYGFGFEEYDGVGRYRTTETSANLPVDASGWITGTSDVNGTFTNAMDLSKKLATSVTVQQCVAKQYFRYGFGRTETSTDQCALNTLYTSLANSGGDMRQLVYDVVTSDAFRYLGTQ